MYDKIISTTEIKTRFQKNRKMGISNDEIIIDMLLDLYEKFKEISHRLYLLNKKINSNNFD